MERPLPGKVRVLVLHVFLSFLTPGHMPAETLECLEGTWVVLGTPDPSVGLRALGRAGVRQGCCQRPQRPHPPWLRCSQSSA